MSMFAQYLTPVPRVPDNLEIQVEDGFINLTNIKILEIDLEQKIFKLYGYVEAQYCKRGFSKDFRGQWVVVRCKYVKEYNVFVALAH